MDQDYVAVRLGDKVWWIDVNGRGKLFEGVVVSVGPKLIRVEGEYGHPRVFRKDTGRTNDEYQHQTLIVDKEAYEMYQSTLKAMRKLALEIGNGRLKDGVTLEDIIAAAKLLKIDLEENNDTRLQHEVSCS